MYIFDLDGTLSNDRWRSARLRGVPRDNGPIWTAYWADCAKDEPIQQTCDLLCLLYVAGTDIEIWTGRDEGWRAETVMWLTKHVGAFTQDLRLLMRPHTSIIPDLQLKASWLARARGDGVKIDGVFDDRNKMVEWWRSQGIICYQVQQGDF